MSEEAAWTHLHCLLEGCCMNVHKIRVDKYAYACVSGVSPDGFNGEEGHQQLQVLHGLQGSPDGGG